MANLGAMGAGAGIAQGIASGLDSYVKTRSTLQEEALKKQLANAQTLEAYSKLADVVGTDQADSLFKQKGLLPGSGMLPNQPSAPQMQPESTNSTATAAGSPGSPLAPNTSTQIDDSGKPNSGDSQGLWSPQQQGTFYQGLMRQPKAIRAGLLETNKVHLQPQAAAEYQKTQGDLTGQLSSQIKDVKDRTETTARNYMDLSDALDMGGTRSKQAALEILPEMFHPGNPRAGDIPTRFEQGSKAREEVSDLIQGKLTGEFSPETKQAIKQAAGILYKNQAKVYKQHIADTSGVFPGANQGISRLGILDQADQYLNKSKMTKPKGLLQGGGGEGVANASQGQGGNGGAIEAEMRRRGFIK